MLLWPLLILSEAIHPVLAFPPICLDYFDGFTLPDDYNKNKSPGRYTLVTLVQYIYEVVKVMGTKLMPNPVVT